MYIVGTKWTYALNHIEDFLFLTVHFNELFHLLHGHFFFVAHSHNLVEGKNELKSLFADSEFVQ